MPTRTREQGSLGRQLARLRGKLHLTQFQLASRSTVSLSVLQKLEQGIDSNPRLRTLLALAEALDVPPGELLVTETPAVSDAQQTLTENQA